MAAEGAFRAQLRLLADEYERLAAENDNYRKALGFGPAAPVMFPELAFPGKSVGPVMLNGGIGNASQDASPTLSGGNGIGKLTPPPRDTPSSPSRPGNGTSKPAQADVPELSESPNGVETSRWYLEMVCHEHEISRTVQPALPGAVETAGKKAHEQQLVEHSPFEPSKCSETEPEPPPGPSPAPKRVTTLAERRKSVTAEKIPKPVAVPDEKDVVDEEAQAGGMNMLILLDIVPAFAILANGVCTGVQTDFPEPELLWRVFEFFFLIFFTLEIVVKVILFGCKEFVWGRDWYWGWFDLFCVGAGVVEIIVKETGDKSSEGGGGGGGIGGLIKLLKLARLGRIVRLLKFKIFAELKSMIQGVFTGLKVLFWAVVLLFLLVYMFGLAVKILFAEKPDEPVLRYPEFSTLPAAMFTVFRCFTDGCSAFDGTPLQERMRLDPVLIDANTDILFFFAYILVYLFVTVGIFNLIMAVFIDNVNEGSIKKKQHHLGMTADKTKWVLAEKFKALCEDSNLTPKEAFTKPKIDPIKQYVKETIEAIDYKITGRKPQSQKEYESRANQIVHDMESRGLVISKDVFNSWFSSTVANVMDVLDDAEIDVSMKFELFEVLDADLGGDLDFREIIDGLMRCRGPVSKVDIASMGMKVRCMTKMIQSMWEKFELIPWERLGIDPEYEKEGEEVLN